VSVVLHEGDCRTVLATLPGESVQCCVTSPPYYGLRDYGCDGQIGLEQSPAEYVAALVETFREVRRVLCKDGTLWLNLGDSYAGLNGGYSGDSRPSNAHSKQRKHQGAVTAGQRRKMEPGLKPKDLMMIPARVALALQADGWWLRSEIIWSKAAPMPESVRDRPTCAHEKVWLLAKAASYFYDADAVAEAATTVGDTRHLRTDGTGDARLSPSGRQKNGNPQAETRNLRNVWHLNPEPFAGAHFATMPATLAERCIKAGSRPGDTVLDPFAGAGTTLLCADRLQRHAVGIELNPEYAAMARKRVAGDAPLFCEVA
jgi:DNA modification methylase